MMYRPRVDSQLGAAAAAARDVLTAAALGDSGAAVALGDSAAAGTAAVVDNAAESA
jgi:hypothetical protein